MASGKETDGFRVSGLQEKEKILDGHLFVLSAVDQKKRGAWLVEPSLGRCALSRSRVYGFR
jgi:hypothetical protein